MIVLQTPTGSRLFGLDNEDSDYDQMIVYSDNRRAEHHKIGDQDITATGLSDFMWKCNRGSPQYLDAMFSQQATVDVIADLRKQYRTTYAAVLPTYTRLIKHLWFTGVEEDDRKKRRHAVRLYRNLKDIDLYGRYNPSMSFSRALYTTASASDAGVEATQKFMSDILNS